MAEVLGIVMTLAIFQREGKYELNRQRLKMVERGLAMMSRIHLICAGKLPSIPGEPKSGIQEGMYYFLFTGGFDAGVVEGRVEKVGNLLPDI